jgi:tetratricopeptide (TPR) repeat protein
VAEKARDLAPDNFDALQTYIAIRRDRAAQEPRSTQAAGFDEALKAANDLIGVAAKQATQAPGDRGAIDQLDKAYQTKESVLIAYHNSFYQADPSDLTGVRRLDKLIPRQEQPAAEVLWLLADLRVKQAALKQQASYFDIRDMLERAISYQPGNVQYQFGLGLVYKNMHLFDQAVRSFQEAIRLDPRHAGAAEQLRALNAPLTSQPAAVKSDTPAASEPATRPATGAPVPASQPAAP